MKNPYQDVMEDTFVNIHGSSSHERQQEGVHERADVSGGRQPIQQHSNSGQTIILNSNCQINQPVRR